MYGQSQWPVSVSISIIYTNILISRLLHILLYGSSSSHHQHSMKLICLSINSSAYQKPNLSSSTSPLWPIKPLDISLLRTIFAPHSRFYWLIPSSVQFSVIYLVHHINSSPLDERWYYIFSNIGQTYYSLYKQESSMRKQKLQKRQSSKTDLPSAAHAKIQIEPWQFQGWMHSATKKYMWCR